MVINDFGLEVGHLVDRILLQLFGVLIEEGVGDSGVINNSAEQSTLIMGDNIAYLEFELEIFQAGDDRCDFGWS